MEQFFTPDDVQKIYDIRKSTLANWRKKKTGPDYVKLRNRILYPATELREWFESQRIVPQQTDNRMPYGLLFWLYY